MTQEDAAVLRQTLIRECTGLTVMMVLLWYLGPGKDLVHGLVHRARTAMGARASAEDAEVARFNTDVSRWDHEQAAHENHKAGGGKPCGCG
jgi:hypothetical protein